MKTMYIFFVALFSFSSCIHSKDRTINAISSVTDSVIESSALARELDNLIRKDESKTPYKLFVIRFTVKNNVPYVTIYTTYYYQKEFTDGYYFRGKNLVVIYNLDKLKNANIINKKRLKLIKDSIPNYYDMTRCNMEFETYRKKFKIISSDSLEFVNE